MHVCTRANSPVCPPFCHPSSVLAAQSVPSLISACVQYSECVWLAKINVYCIHENMGFIANTRKHLGFLSEMCGLFKIHIMTGKSLLGKAILVAHHTGFLRLKFFDKGIYTICESSNYWQRHLHYAFKFKLLTCLNESPCAILMPTRPISMAA